jgi:hypothetical protein
MTVYLYNINDFIMVEQLSANDPLARTLGKHAMRLYIMLRYIIGRQSLLPPPAAEWLRAKVSALLRPSLEADENGDYS